MSIPFTEAGSKAYDYYILYEKAILEHIKQVAAIREEGFDTKEALVRDFYWGDRLIPMYLLEAAFEMPRSEILEIAGYFRARGVCRGCGRSIHLIAEDREHLDELQSIRFRCASCVFREDMAYDKDLDERVLAHKARIAELKAMPYDDYLKTPEWQAVREKALERADYRCQVCNKDREAAILDTHHRTYERRGEEKPDDVTVLCRGCHEMFHENGRVARNAN